MGWDDDERIHSCSLHIDIKNGKIWIQHNGTEDHIAYDLVAKGVPKEDIVLGFHSVYMRQYTDFYVNYIWSRVSTMMLFIVPKRYELLLRKRACTDAEQTAKLIGAKNQHKET
ncbi:FdxN element excision controlling factor protein [Candidatus Thiomargarita nelsonii]|uniref:FdxN element excision controlling factor protein n=1 Tax=Candidatus Thiomargarita nelsonii TaxID=1003181 RepID=A0A176RWT2_9GAMM|nr:FdxN element excision controlling factor protein [Candidatus Thiomargarita nelsonii]